MIHRGGGLCLVLSRGDPVKRFMVERDIPEIGTAERAQLRDAAAQSNSVLTAMQSEGKGIQWGHSYVVQDKTFCV